MQTICTRTDKSNLYVSLKLVPRSLCRSQKFFVRWEIHYSATTDLLCCISSCLFLPIQLTVRFLVSLLTFKSFKMQVDRCDAVSLFITRYYEAALLRHYLKIWVKMFHLRWQTKKLGIYSNRYLEESHTNNWNTLWLNALTPH